MYTVHFTIHPFWVTLILSLLAGLIVILTSALPTRNPHNRHMLAPPKEEKLLLFALFFGGTLITTLLFGHGLDWLLSCGGSLVATCQIVDILLLIGLTYSSIGRYWELAKDLHYTLERVDNNESEMHRLNSRISHLQDSEAEQRGDVALLEERNKQLLLELKHARGFAEKRIEPVTITQTVSSRKLIRNKEVQS